MEVAIIKQLVNYWGENKRPGLNEDYINKVLKEKRVTLPEDFKVLYKHSNGTKDQDENAFTFFKLEDLVTIRNRFNLNVNNPNSNVLLFVDYMVDCWWYGVRIKPDESYEIGIVPTSDKFIVITTSLGEFIDLYLKDSPLLYKY